MSNARMAYDRLSTGRNQFLNTAVECAELTLPYLLTEDTNTPNSKRKLPMPWSSVGLSGGDAVSVDAGTAAASNNVLQTASPRR